MTAKRNLTLALSIALAAATCEAIAADEASSLGPRGMPPRRTAAYRDALVEPATFAGPADAKPLLPTDWDAAPAPGAATAKRPSDTAGASPAVSPEAPSAKSDQPESPGDATPRAEFSTQPIAAGSAKPTAPAPRRRPLVVTKKPEKQAVTPLTGPFDSFLKWRPQGDPTVAVVGALCAVVGLVLLAGAVVRRSLPRSSRVLPKDVAEVLGRVPLAGKQTAQLLRIGRRLLLVNVTPDGAETLVEIRDEEEVQRLLAACDRTAGVGAEAEFDRVFREMAGEPARDGFLGDEADAFDPRRLAEAYSQTPGGRGYA